MHAHLDSWQGWLDKGDRVRAGKKFAEAGDTGNAIGAHLHFQTGKGSDSSIKAHKPEFMTGIRESNSRYKGWNDFGKWGITQDNECDSEQPVQSPYWFSAAPLSDVVLYGWLGESTGTSTRFANGFGDWKKDQQASTDECCYTVHPGFFAHPTDGWVHDEVSDLLFYFDDSTADQWQVWIRKPGNESWKVIDGDDAGQPTFMTGAEVHTGDFNGDGRTDIMLYDKDFSGSEAKFETWFSDGDGSWDFGKSNTWSAGAGWDLLTGDFNDDTQTDILQYERDGTGWRVRRSNASGNGGFTTMNSGNFGTPTSRALTPYLDNDRYSDLYRFDHDGTFWAVQAWDPSASGGDGNFVFQDNGNWGSAVDQTLVGYFDNDHRHDLLRYNEDNGNWATKRADGSGGWSHNGGSFDDGRVIHTAHLDQDERTDIVLYDPSLGLVAVRFATGGADFTGDQCDPLVGSGCTWPTDMDDIGHIVFAYYDRNEHAD